MANDESTDNQAARSDKYERQVDSIRQTYLEHGATAEEAEREALAIVAKVHGRAEQGAASPGEGGPEASPERLGPDAGEGALRRSG